MVLESRVVRVFDTRWFGLHGIGRFASEIYRRLEGFGPISLGGRPSRPIDPWVLSAFLRANGASLFLSPGFNVPVGASCPFFFCLHDLNPLWSRTESTLLKRAYYAYIIKPGVRRAERVFTVSEFSRAAIIDWACVNEERVINIGNGVSESFRPDGDVTQLAQRPYFLHVGGSREHKNLARVIRALAESPRLAECRLACSGSPSNDIVRQIERAGLAHRVKFLGNVSDEEMARLYRGAAALVFVSLAEGFGLPIVEAMACGCPVITASVTAMPEVAGGAAMVVDPYDVGQIRDAMEKIAEDASLRRVLQMRGVERAKQFCWDQTAARVREALVNY